MLRFSRVGAPPPLACFFVALLGLLLWHRRRGGAAFFAVAAIGAMALNFAAKILVGRARPDLWVAIAPEHGFSFPSGHAMGSIAAVTALVAPTWGTRWRRAAVGFGALFVALAGLSRLYLGVHYPSDVLTGWLASLAWVGGCALSRSSALRRAARHHSRSSHARLAGTVHAATSERTTAAGMGRGVGHPPGDVIAEGWRAAQRSAMPPSIISPIHR